MGVRLGIGVGILILFLLLGILAGNGLDLVCREMSASLSQAAQYAEQGDLNNATELVSRIYGQWQKRKNTMALLVDHSPMDEIEGLFAKVQLYCRMGEAAEIGAQCARIASLIDALADAHRLTWWNVV